MRYITDSRLLLEYGIEISYSNEGEILLEITTQNTNSRFFVSDHIDTEIDQEIIYQTESSYRKLKYPIRYDRN